jgi:hypothetical protein
MMRLPSQFTWDVLRKCLKDVEQSYIEFFRALGFLPLVDYLCSADQPLTVLDAKCNPTHDDFGVLVWFKDTRARTPVYALEVFETRSAPTPAELRQWLLKDAGVAPIILLRVEVHEASGRMAHGVYYIARPEILCALSNYSGYGSPLKTLVGDDANLIHPSLLRTLFDACQTLIAINARRTQAVMQYLEQDLRENEGWLDGLAIDAVLKEVQP